MTIELKSLGLLAALCGCGFLGPAAARAAELDGAVPIELQILPANDDHLNLRLNQRLIPWTQIESALGFRSPEISVRSDPQQKRLHFQAGPKPVALSLGAFPNSKLLLPSTNELDLAVDQPRRILDLQTPVANRQRLTLLLPDRAAADAGPGSALRYDLFSDQSYYLAGRGDIKGRTAEGRPFEVSEKQLPVSGGPLHVPDNATPNQRFQKLKPDTQVTITGTVDGELTIQIGNETIPMSGRGERRLVQLPNGTKVEFWQNLSLTMLEWKVFKGLLFFQVEGVPGWEAIFRSDQAGQIQWDSNAHLLDLHNISVNSSIFARLQTRSVVRIDPKGVLQYAYVNPYTFRTVASGAPTFLHTEASSTDTDLTRQALTFVNGQLKDSTPKLGLSNPETINATWDYGIPLQLDSIAKNLSMPTNTKRIVELGEGRKVAIQYDDKGRLQITAVEGEFIIRMSALSGIAVKLSESDSATLDLDLKKGTFLVRSDAENHSPVHVETSTGATSSLGPDKYLNFRVGNDGSLTATSGGQLLIYEPAGSQPTTTPKAQIPTVIRKDDDITRIPQTPASPFQ